MTDPKPIELLPCPFCGGTDIHLTQDLGRGTRVLCEGCRATASHYMNEKAAASAWNRRAAQEPKAAPQTGLGTSCPDKDNRQSASAAPDSGGMPEQVTWHETGAVTISYEGETRGFPTQRAYAEYLRERLAYALSLREKRETLREELKRQIINEIFDYVRNYPVAPREEGWIPVSERLPEEHIGKFLVTNNLKARDAFGFMSHVWLATLLHHDDEHGWYAFDDYDNRVPQNITHWMPLPEPPK